jgi:uncharacterized protein
MMQGRIVCNTGPLIALAIIDQLGILKALFREILVPEAVHQEILQGGPVLAGMSRYREAHWIKVQVLNRPLDILLSSVLDAGEASVIQLAQETDTELVLIDELKARKLVRTVFHLQVVGSVRLLVEAKRLGSIRNVGDAIQGMRDGGYWIHDDIVQFALREAGEL